MLLPQVLAGNVACRFVVFARRHGLLVLLVIAVMMNVTLASEVRRQRQNASRPALGRVVGPLNALSLDGQDVVINYAGSLPTILYFFSPSCRWCERNWDNVRALQEATRKTHRFVGISTTRDVTRLAADRRLAFEIVTTPSPGSRLDYHLGATPQTIVVGRDARILQVWQGAYIGSTAREVEYYFRTTLPGVSAPR